MIRYLKIHVAQHPTGELAKVEGDSLARAGVGGREDGSCEMSLLALSLSFMFERYVHLDAVRIYS